MGDGRGVRLAVDRPREGKPCVVPHGVEDDERVPGDGVVPVAARGAREVGAALLEMDFDGYFFTGSYATGKYIYEKVADKMVPVGLELGGKDPLYVASDVKDIKGIAAGTADGAFY
ncbi:MAG TPA: aldehyde dehydrogenase family protein, partial [Chitinophagales bacterium]|nr:aldehyde dehydrogenase family protein [Chitinophagales bacterium]